MYTEEVKFRVTIRVLFYCDDSDENYLPVQKKTLRHDSLEFGLGLAKKALEDQSNFFTQYKVDVVNRNYDYTSDGGIDHANPKPASHKITRELLNRYSQIWIFGMHYRNYPDYIDHMGGPEAELTDPEVSALREWMDNGGGVLITGDHSNQVNDRLLNLGRALGIRVPRAGELRVWEGPPASGPPDYYVDTAGDFDMGRMSKQEDATPQTIRVKYKWNSHREKLREGLFNIVDLTLDPHPLFSVPVTNDNPQGVIDVFPDHSHEGAIRIPKTLDPAVWPTRGSWQPSPEIVAWGTNKAKPFIFSEVGLVAVYNGDPVGVGRIVADSTWHHFTNVNLVGFLEDDNSLGPTLRRMGQYYANLAYYLSNRKIRQRLLNQILLFSMDSPTVREVYGSPSEILGQTALRVVSNYLNPGMVSDLLRSPVVDLVSDRALAKFKSIPLLDPAVVFGEMLIVLKAGTITLDDAGDLVNGIDVQGQGVANAVKAEILRQEQSLETWKVAFDPNAQLLGYWKFDEEEGMFVKDDSSHNNHGKLDLGSGSVLPSRIASSHLFGLRFNGLNSVNIPRSPSLEPDTLTVMAWVKGNRPQDLAYILSKGADSTTAASFALYSGNNNGLIFYIYDGDSYYSSPEISVPDEIWNNEWFHVAGSYDGSSVRLYINGLEVGSGTAISTSIKYDLPTDQALLIGSYFGSSGFVGDIDEVMIWRGAMTTEEISEFVVNNP
jgi:hypothetical protein